MGFFDRKVSGAMDAMFDLNHDGLMSAAEDALMFDFLENELSEKESRGFGVRRYEVDADDFEEDDDLDEYDRDDFDDEFDDD